MTDHTYLDAAASLPKLAVQLQQAISDARLQHSARDAKDAMREAEALIADGRGQIVAALTRSEECLKAMGLDRLPAGLAAPSPGLMVDPDSLEGALDALRRLIDDVVTLSVAQANAVEEHGRLLVAARKAEDAEQRRAAQEQERRERETRELAEREARERAEQARREAERRSLQDELDGVQARRDALDRRMWRPSKKRQLADLDAEIRALKQRLAKV